MKLKSNYLQKLHIREIFKNSKFIMAILPQEELTKKSGYSSNDIFIRVVNLIAEFNPFLNKLLIETL